LPTPSGSYERRWQGAPTVPGHARLLAATIQSFTAKIHPFTAEADADAANLAAQLGALVGCTFVLAIGTFRLLTLNRASVGGDRRLYELVAGRDPFHLHRAECVRARPRRQPAAMEWSCMNRS
jgi:hypothetical protein